MCEGGINKVKIDIYSHILPGKYLSAFGKISKKAIESGESVIRAAVDIENRLRLMERYPEVLQVLTIALPPVDMLAKRGEAVELARIANEELAELVAKYPNKFLAGVASLPLNDIDAAVNEIDRAICQLGLKGIQLFASLGGDRLDNPKFKPIYEKMAKYDLPIWIHPTSDQIPDDPEFGVFGWPYATSNAMLQIVTAGVFNDYPDIKFVIHHCGAMIPYFEGRIKWLFPDKYKSGESVGKWGEHFRKFYTDTATYSSSPSALKCGYDYFGPDHLLFGTDSPFPTFGLTLETIKAVQRMAISESDREKIFYQNASKLLRMDT